MENEENSTDADLIYIGEEYIDQDQEDANANAAENEYISFEHNPDDVHEIDGVVNSEDEKRGFADINDSENKDDPNGHGKVENLMVVDEWDDDDLDQDEDDEGEENYDEDVINPEEIEKALLNMPTMKNLMDDIGHLKQNRKVIISPISMSDFNDDLLQEVINWTTLEEIKVAYARNYQENNSLIGILMLHFNTSTSATNAVSYLKDWKDGVNIKLDTNSHRLMEDFLDNVRSKKRWTDNVAILKNLSNDVTVESIKELFPNVEDIVLHLESQGKRNANNTSNNVSTTVNKESSESTTATVANTDNPDAATATTAATTATTATEESADSGAATEVAANKSEMDTTEAVAETATTATSETNVTAISVATTPHLSKGYAYLVFSNEETMKAEVADSTNKKMMLNGAPVVLISYRAPVHSIPRSYLKLRERKVIMKHMEKCQTRLETAKNDGNTKALTKLEERIEQCKLAIERDDKCRKDMDIEAPTLDELKSMKGLPPMDPKMFQRVLIRFGIVKEKKKKSPSQTTTSNVGRRRSNAKDGGGDRKTSGRGSYNNNNNTGRRSPYQKNRRSPYNSNNNNRNKRSWGSSNNYNSNRGQRSGPGGRNMPQSLLGNAGNMVNPLSLLIQPNLGILGSGGVLNPNMLMQSNMGMLNSGAGLLGSPYSGLGGLSMEENKNKLIRLDETGNFRPANMGGATNRFNNNDDRNRRMADNRFRDSGGNRRKSRSPGRSRTDYDMSRGVDDDSSIPVNMLLSLSQMLSQKMDEKRQQIERRGPRDRDYRNNQR